MISATNLQPFQSTPVRTESLGETKTTTTQSSSLATSPILQIPRVETELSATTTNTSLPQMLDTVVTMLQNLMKMIQGLLVGPNTTDKDPTAIPTPNSGMPSEEPPTVIPVGSLNTTPQTITVPPTESGATSNSAVYNSTQSTSNKTTRDTQGATATGTQRTRAAKGTKRRKSSKSSINGRGQFLWKPKSEKDGKLAVLLPKQYTGKVASLEVLSPDGQQKLAQGKASGVGNGDREHFRFSSSGDAFPDGSIVLVTLKDGSTRQVEIKNTSARFTR
jgi:hypothetical protein